MSTPCSSQVLEAKAYHPSALLPCAQRSPSCILHTTLESSSIICTHVALAQILIMAKCCASRPISCLQSAAAHLVWSFIVYHSCGMPATIACSQDDMGLCRGKHQPFYSCTDCDSMWSLPVEDQTLTSAGLSVRIFVQLSVCLQVGISA